MKESLGYLLNYLLEYLLEYREATSTPTGPGNQTTER